MAILRMQQGTTISILHTNPLPAPAVPEIRASFSQMAEGIDNAKTVGVFVTTRYIDKASGKGGAGADDNCKFEVSSCSM